MRVRQVTDMYVVTNAGSVRHIIIHPKDIHPIPLALYRLVNNSHEMRFGVVRLADSTISVSAGSVKNIFCVVQFIP